MLLVLHPVYLSLQLRFVAERAQFFTVACADGSHPLVWTQYHQEYKDLFEAHLNKVLHALEMDADQFASFCNWLRINADIFEELAPSGAPFFFFAFSELAPSGARVFRS